MTNIFIIGVGLIGGSLALNLRKIYPKAKIFGFGGKKENLQTAKKLKIIDEISTDIASIKNSDFVVIAAPVGAFTQILKNIRPYLNNQLIIDVGSTKTSIIEDVKNVLNDYAKFIPSHPIAGKETTGSISADINLFKDKKVIICPTKNNSNSDLELIKNIWKKCGSNVEEMNAKIHDEIFAITSHLPHLVSFAFMHFINQQKNALHYSGGGLKDFSRIAESDATMWSNIFFNNKENLINHLDKFINEMQNIKKSLLNNDNLINYIKQANNIKSNLDK